MPSSRTFLLLLLTSVVPGVACSAASSSATQRQDDTSADGGGAKATTGVAALGNGSHSRDAVEWTVIATAADGLDGPRDLDFNPYSPRELWVVSRNDDSVVRVTDAGTDRQKTEHRIDSYALHFMEEVSAISFSQTETFHDGNLFATCGESNNTYNDRAMGNGFMGPALWTSDWDVFGFPNPEAVAAVGGDLGSHVDMMHESPYCMGVGWETKNVYWTVDGKAGTISRYDFAEHHDVGYDDHSDGTVYRYKDVGFVRAKDIPSHIVFDHGQGVVYYNDTGNGRTMRFDPKTATRSSDHSHQSQDHATYEHYTGGELTELRWFAVNEELGLPSGIALSGDVLYVTETSGSTIYALNKNDGTVIDYLETNLEPRSLMGLRVDAEGSIWFVDHLANEVVRLRGKPTTGVE